MTTISDNVLRRGKFSKKLGDLPLRPRASRNVAVNKPDLTKYQQPPSYTFDVTLNLKRKSADVSSVALDTSKKLKLTDGSPVNSKKGKHVTFHLVDKVHHAEAAPVYAKNENRPKSEGPDLEAHQAFLKKEMQRLKDEKYEDEMITDLRAEFMGENIPGALEFVYLLQHDGLSWMQADVDHSTFLIWFAEHGGYCALAGCSVEDMAEESD